MTTQEKLNIANTEIRNEMIACKELAEQEKIENINAHIESYIWDTAYNSARTLLMYGTNEEKIDWADKNSFYLNA